MNNRYIYSQTTRGIKVTVTPFYLEEQSVPKDHHFVWVYTVSVENLSDENVQLINRYWHITDAMGAVQEVRGAGVVGEQPKLKPHESFQYTSGAALKTQSGIMTGTYEMENDARERFIVQIPPFSLDSPEQVKRPN